jgi:peroxiredoxin
MPKRESRMATLGSAAPDFALSDGRGREFRLADRDRARPFLIAFICNHCPYVVHILPAFVEFARAYRARGLDVVAISANDPTAYPADAPERMAELAARLDFPFPYLYDATQSVALAYGAICTPDFFLYDAAGSLVYRGQFDDSRPGSALAVTGSSLRLAADAALAGRPPVDGQRASIGCSIKWRADRAPDWG